MSRPSSRTPLRQRVLLSFAVSTAATLALALTVMRIVALGPTYPLKAVIVFAAIGAVALGWLDSHAPLERFGAANWITTGRAVLLATAAGFVGEPRTAVVAALAAGGAVLAAMLDGVDGWVARRTGGESDFGARYDMETDALLILVLSVLAWQHGQAGWWILLAGLMRYGFVAAGYAWNWMNAALPPSTRRKTVCVIQIAGLAAVVSPVFAPPMSALLAAFTLLALVYSFTVDVVWLHQRRA
jgi:phosphatidylglycerophosphate synthase